MNYRNGGEGMVKWAEDHLYLPIYYPFENRTSKWWPIKDLPDTPHPVTGKSYKDFWLNQTKVLKEALVMEKGEFKHKLIVLCWERGEGKSLVVCMIQLWKFFNWPRQQIVLGANSKDQVRFVHFDLMRDLILNSPKLRKFVGERNIQEKEIKLVDSGGRAKSIIRAISSFSGIVSNVTGYTFSEMFDMKKPKFFVQLDGSTRAVPNSLGTIDSTVSAKDHILYELYNGYVDQKVESLYFSYRCSEFGDVRDYWNPNMDQRQLNDYRVKFPFGEFERYFLNQWSAGSGHVFSDEQIEEMGIMGCGGELFNHTKIAEVLDQVKEHKLRRGKYEEMGSGEELAASTVKITNQIQFTINIAIDAKRKELIPVENYYTFVGPSKMEMVSADVLDKLGDYLDTDWAILVGMDFSDPLSVKSKARTIMTIMAKGLIGSRSKPYSPKYDISPAYIYLILYLIDVEDHSVGRIKREIEEAIVEYDGIDSICSERYGAWDLNEWATEKGVYFEAVYPNYNRQKDAFKEFYDCMDNGRFKCPSVPIQGSRGEDILREEMGIFEHLILPGKTNGWFGSPEKNEKNGIQDDVLYAIAWGMYGGRLISYLNFRPRRSGKFFGQMIQNKGNYGVY